MAIHHCFFSTAARVLLIAFIAIQLWACSDTTSEDYFPLDAGRTWHYDISRTTMDGTFQQKQILRTLPAISWENLHAVPVLSAGGAEYLYAGSERGVQRIGTKPRGAPKYMPASQPVTILPEPLTVGASWQQTEFTQVLENTGSPWETLFKITEPVVIEYAVESNDAWVEVPGGEFRQCIKVSGRGSTNVDVGNYIGRTIITIEVENFYARGVGLVKSVRRESTTSEALDHGEVTFALEYVTQ